MSAQLAEWGVDLTFIRTRVGAEEAVINRLLEQGDSSEFFVTYGYFDVTAVRCISDLPTPALVPLDYDVIEAAPFRFFPDATSVQSEFCQRISAWDAAIAVFLKVTPGNFQTDPDAARTAAAHLIRETFGSVDVFYGLGYSELLLLAGGTNLPFLLSKVTELRSVVNGVSGIPSFIRSATFPLTSWKRIHAEDGYDRLEGEVRPVVTVGCRPATEGAIADSIRSSEIEVHNMFGDTDLTVYWRGASGPTFGAFARFIFELRRNWNTNNVIGKTTSYLETLNTATGNSANQNIATQAREPIQPTLLEKLKTVNPVALRASIADLVLRLGACLQDEAISADFRDMIRTFPFVESVVDRILGETNELEIMKARLTLIEVADLARSAINQRYAGLETHPETLAHSQSPLLCDIRSLVAAASAVPHFIFGNLRPDEQDLWAGYVLFGSTYWPLQHAQNILALPAFSVFRPVEEWWKITHEIGHAVHELFPIEDAIDPIIYDNLLAIYDASPTSVEGVISEVFANWFDWKYVFQKNTNFFLQKIWSSWLTFPAVWEQQRQYLVRSFAIWLASSFEELGERLSAGRANDHVIPYLQERWVGFQSVLSTLPQASRYFRAVDSVMLDDIFRQVQRIAGLIEFFEFEFEEVCRVSDLGSRLNPAYPDLAKHVESLLNGVVITEPIPSPITLHLSLLATLENNRPSLRTEVAFILTLEQWFSRTSAGSPRP